MDPMTGQPTRQTMAARMTRQRPARFTRNLTGLAATLAATMIVVGLQAANASEQPTSAGSTPRPPQPTATPTAAAVVHPVARPAHHKKRSIVAVHVQRRVAAKPVAAPKAKVKTAPKPAPPPHAKTKPSGG
jgi:hypothetical protein